MQPQKSILDDQAISGCYLFPQPRRVSDPFMVQVSGAELACYRKIIDPANFTLVHFHGNGEAVADYVPWMADLFSTLGLNSLFIEYREYGSSPGKAQLVAMLGDGEAAIAAAGLNPEKVIAFGRSIGSLYAIELVHRQPTIAGLILESSIAIHPNAFWPMPIYRVLASLKTKWSPKPSKSSTTNRNLLATIIRCS
jgi:alpha-beta hydrolase superfamily lysophospholipase